MNTSQSIIDTTTSFHSTTRGPQKKVFYHDGKWFVFYTNGRDAVYKVSTDGGKTWSKPSIVLKGQAHSSSIDIIHEGKTFYYFYSEKVKLNPPAIEPSAFVAHVKKGILSGTQITFHTPVRIFEPQGPNDTYFYSSAAKDSTGYFWIASRHLMGQEGRDMQNLIAARSSKPNDISSWESGAQCLNHTDIHSLAPDLVGLDEGKMFVIAKATEAGKFYANLFGGKSWGTKDMVISNTTTVRGDDKRMAAQFDPHTKKVHVIYVDENRVLRHRTLSKPYLENNWTPSLSEEGEIVEDAPVFCGVLSIDISTKPARLFAVYGKTLFLGRDPRSEMGQLYLKAYDGVRWSQPLLLSESDAKHDWYPTISNVADSYIGVMYVKGNQSPLEIIFTTVDVNQITFSH